MCFKLKKFFYRFLRNSYIKNQVSIILQKFNNSNKVQTKIISYWKIWTSIKSTTLLLKFINEYNVKYLTSGIGTRLESCESKHK